MLPGIFHGTEQHVTISQNFLGMNYGTAHSLVHLIHCLEHPTKAMRCVYMVQLNLNLTLIFDHSLILFESRIDDRVFFVNNSCGVMNLTRNWWKPSLFMSLLMNPAEEIHEQDSTAGTQDLPIKFLCVLT